ncbi:hypothetical protein [Shewanella sp.]|uniref:hypothetical protein n=1 Tax=Shewanella sp. TaxID=50422 RepID=UPI003A96FC66
MEITNACSALATIQVGVARSDGRLSINSKQLTFEPLNKQVGFGPYCLEREQIRSVRHNILREQTITNQLQSALEIELNSGETYQFIIADTDKWLSLLQPRG